tara:strand:+ start:50 stop:520 length:471 start_codon:yes stop_codon:yes gene_type:complete
MRNQDLKSFSEEVKKGFVEALGDKSSFSNQITVYDSLDAPDTSGSSLKGYLSYGFTYNDLVDYFGNPTFLPEDSGDGKVNFEWVVEYETEENGIQLFTIYDWKTESAEWSKENTGTLEQKDEWFGSRWHVGGKEYAGDFIEFLEKDIKKFGKELPF